MMGAINPPNTPIVDIRGMVTPPWYRFFVGQKRGQDGIAEASVLTIDNETSALVNSRQFTLTPEDFSAADSGAGGAYTMSLASVGITAGTYGDSSNFVSVTVDEKGRVTGVATYPAAGGNNAQAEIDFGITPTDGASVSIPIAGMTDADYVDVWIQASDTTADNDATAHSIAAASLRLIPSCAADTLTIDAHAMFGLATGKFNVRYSYA